MQCCSEMMAMRCNSVTGPCPWNLTVSAAMQVYDHSRDAEERAYVQADRSEEQGALRLPCLCTPMYPLRRRIVDMRFLQQAKSGATGVGGRGRAVAARAQAKAAGRGRGAA